MVISKIFRKNFFTAFITSLRLFFHLDATYQKPGCYVGNSRVFVRAFDTEILQPKVWAEQFIVLQKIRISGGLTFRQHNAHIVQAVFIHGDDGKSLPATGAAHHTGFSGAGLRHMLATAGTLIEKKDFHSIRSHGLNGSLTLSHGRPPCVPDPRHRCPGPDYAPSWGMKAPVPTGPEA